MKIKKVNISDLKPYPENPNTHPVEQINELESGLEEFDQVKNIVAWKGLVVAGNGLLKAAKNQGRKTIEVQDVSDWSEEKAIKFMIADNRLAEMAIMDDDILADLLKDLGDPLDVPGIDEAFLESLDIEIDIDENEEKEKSELATKPFGDKRDTISMRDLLHSVDLVKVSFSGGKDSAGMAIYLHTHFEIPKEKILLEHYYNPFEWEDMPEYCRYFAETFGAELKEYGNEPPDEEKEKVKIYGKRNADNFMIEKIKSHGLPSVYQKWCFERYKQRVFSWVARRYKKTKYIQAIGMRATESPRRAKLEDRGITRDIQPFCYPIFNLSDEETFGLAIKNNIKLHHAYRFFGRTGCPVCPMSPAQDFIILRKEYPAVWDKALQLFLLSLECNYYRTTDDNRVKADFERYLGISHVKKSKRKEWIPPNGLKFWRGLQTWQDVFQPV